MSCEEMSRRRPLSLASPAAPPLEDEDLLTEILLRLPPQPSSLPRASAVSDPRFIRRFRIHHSRNPPLLGFFAGNLNFVPTMDPPNRVPDGRFSFQPDHGDDRYPWLRLLGCCHGLVLMFLTKRLQVLVWDLVTSDQHPIAIHPGFAPLDSEDTTIHGAVIRATGDVGHFQVGHGRHSKTTAPCASGCPSLLVGDRSMGQSYINTASTHGNQFYRPTSQQRINTEVPGVLVEDSIYWLLCDSLLKFDLYGQRLAVIPMPMYGYQFSLMRADSGGLGCLLLSEFNARLWKRKTDCDGVGSWVLEKTIKLDNLLFINLEKTRRPPRLQGFAEENNVLLLWTDIGIFTIQVESLQFKKLFKTNYVRHYYAFESVYTAGTASGGGHDGAELLDRT